VDSERLTQDSAFTVAMCHEKRGWMYNDTSGKVQFT
jgi:hypothetical protein